MYMDKAAFKEFSRTVLKNVTQVEQDTKTIEDIRAHDPRLAELFEANRKSCSDIKDYLTIRIGSGS